MATSTVLLEPNDHFGGEGIESPLFAASQPDREQERLLRCFKDMGAPNVDLAGDSCTRVRSPESDCITL